jgi:hypothetical protein
MNRRKHHPGHCRAKGCIYRKKFDLSDLSWSFSPNVVINKFGRDTAIDVRPLAVIPKQDHYSDNTTCISFKFVVPPDLFKTSGQISNNWIEFLPQAVAQSIPPEISGLNKDQLIDMINLLTQSPQSYNTIASGLAIPIEKLSLLCRFSVSFSPHRCGSLQILKMRSASRAIILYVIIADSVKFHRFPFFSIIIPESIQ